MPTLLSQEQLYHMFQDILVEVRSRDKFKNECFTNGYNRLKSLGLALTPKILDTIIQCHLDLKLGLDLVDLCSSQLEECEPNVLSKFISSVLQKLTEEGMNIKNFINLCFHYGANVHYRDEQGNTLLHIAMSNITEISGSLISFLLERQVDIHAQNNLNQTAYQYGDYSAKADFLDELVKYQKRLDFQQKRQQLDSLLEYSIQRQFNEIDAVPLCAIAIIVLNAFGNSSWVKDTIQLKNESIQRTNANSKLFPLSIFNYKPDTAPTQEPEQGLIRP